MKTHVILNAGAGDYYGNPVLYLKSDRDRYIVITKTLHGNITYRAYNACVGFYRTLKHATIHIARAELGQLPHTRWKWNHIYQRLNRIVITLRQYV